MPVTCSVVPLSGSRCTKLSQQVPHRSPVWAKYGAVFVSSNSYFYSASVTCIQFRVILDRVVTASVFMYMALMISWFSKTLRRSYEKLWSYGTNIKLNCKSILEVSLLRIYAFFQKDELVANIYTIVHAIKRTFQYVNAVEFRVFRYDNTKLNTTGKQSWTPSKQHDNNM